MSNLYFNGMIINVGVRNKNAMSVIQNPTGNCQLWIIGCFYALFNTTLTPKERRELLSACHEASGWKQLLMVDIQSGYAEQVKKLFKGRIRNEFPYSSTNSSAMVIFLIHTDQAGNWLENIK